MSESVASALSVAQPSWLGAMLRELRTAQTKQLQMSWTIGLRREGNASRAEMRHCLNELFAHFERQPFRGRTRTLPELDEHDRGLPEADEVPLLVDDFETLMERAARRRWQVELAVDYDHVGRPLYHLLGYPHRPQEPFVPLHVVRYYLVDAIRHALVESDRYGPRER